MVKNCNYTRTKYILSHVLALIAAFLTFKTFYIFESKASFSLQIIVLNFGIMILLWFMSFNHTKFIRKNIFMAVILPLLGLHITNTMMILTSPGTSFIGYLGFLVFSSLMIFISYKARVYEEQLQKHLGIF